MVPAVRDQNQPASDMKLKLIIGFQATVNTRSVDVGQDLARRQVAVLANGQDSDTMPARRGMAHKRKQNSTSNLALDFDVA